MGRQNTGFSFWFLSVGFPLLHFNKTVFPCFVFLCLHACWLISLRSSINSPLMFLWYETPWLQNNNEAVSVYFIIPLRQFCPPKKRKLRKMRSCSVHENSAFLPFMLKSTSYFCKFTLFYFFLIIDPPSITINKTRQTVEEGDNIMLTCNVTGKPQPIISWTELGSSEVLSNTSSLTIVNVSRPEIPDNMIQYQCTASNGVGTPTTATVNVTVHCKYI